MEKINKELKLVIYREDHFDHLFQILQREGLEDDIYTIIPNVREARRILDVCHVRYEEIGLWIFANGNDICTRFYDNINNAYMALDKSDLLPVVGEGKRFSKDYLEYL